MTARNLVLVALPLLATCIDGGQAPAPAVEAQPRALGKVPPSEVATWQRVGLGNSPQARFLQAVAWDEKRGVVVMFGGEAPSPFGWGAPQCNQETWEWSPAAGKWTNRTGTGTAPGARAGASLVYDSTENIFVLFGGRTTSGVNYEDTWEWDPTGGAWTDRTGAGNHPSARGQHGMVYQKSTGKLLLFGGGTIDTSAVDGTSVSTSLKDTWEYDPVAHSWVARSPTTGPSARHDFGLVWDASRNRAILFGGLQVDPSSTTSVAKQDVWEWDPTGSGTWTDRTALGTKPSVRYGHALAYDGSRKKVVLFGGSDINTAANKNDLWDLDPTGFTWTQRLSGSEAGLPAARIYASLVSDNTKGRLELVAGALAGSGSSGDATSGAPSLTGSNEVWELDPATPAFTNKTPASDLPPPRSEHAMAYNPATQKVYLFGGYAGYSESGQSPIFNDLWEWDGKAWTQVVTSDGPPVAHGAALAYDPVRESLILYGGLADLVTYGDTWEWSSTTREWTKLETTGNPGPICGHGMVTDTTRGKILLFGNGNGYPWAHVWEWDGGTLTWTDRTPVTLMSMAASRAFPLMAYDEGRQRLFLCDGTYVDSRYPQSASAFWEWDPATAGWTMRDPGGSFDTAHSFYATYDPIRRRVVMLTDAPYGNSQQTRELDTIAATWYVRTLSTQPSGRGGAAIAFDRGRGVAVLFGGQISEVNNETWEYHVTNLGNGEGCTADSVQSCASGNCVDRVCCDAASCTGACKSCNVPGSEGTCKLAPAGMEVPGSCENGQACDGAGTCKSKNGQACTGNATCASGFCVDGICCDSTCTGACVACNLSGRAGQCSPHPAGTDPKGECGVGTEACKSSCDGAGACSFPGEGTTCGSCGYCDRKGQCNEPLPTCVNTNNGGTTGSTTSIRKGTGGSSGATGKGGAGGDVSGSGGMGGDSGAGGTRGSGGAGSGSGGATGRSGSGGNSMSGSGNAGAGGDAAGGAGASQGGASGAPTAGSGGASGGREGSGTTNRDGSSDGVGTGVAPKASRSGCSCAVGAAQSQRSGLVPLSALVGVALVFRWLRRKNRGFTGAQR